MSKRPISIESIEALEKRYSITAEQARALLTMSRGALYAARAEVEGMDDVSDEAIEEHAHDYMSHHPAQSDDDSGVLVIDGEEVAPSIPWPLEKEPRT